jgi:hypothetical protein
MTSFCATIEGDEEGVRAELEDNNARERRQKKIVFFSRSDLAVSKLFMKIFWAVG